MRGGIATVVAAAGLALAGCGGSPQRVGGIATTTVPAPSTTTTDNPNSPPDPPPPATLAVDGAAWSGNGELAFVSRGQLYVLTDSGRLVTITGPHAGGTFAYPSWSPDGAWLAFDHLGQSTTQPITPTAAPAGTARSSLWIVQVGNTGEERARRVAPSGIGKFAWRPVGSPMLAYETIRGSNSVTLFEDEPNRPPKTVIGISPFAGGFAWSPDGTQLAVATGQAATAANGEHFVSNLQVVPAAGGPVVTWRTSTTDLVDVAGWWPNGGGLLYWLDAGASSSVAADGLDLYSQATGGPARRLATTLTNPYWLAWSPDGTTVALVAGGGRAIWGGNKEVETCDPVAATCTPVATAPGTETISPAWSSTGTLSVISASDSAPFGDQGIASFTYGWMNQWNATHELLTIGADGLTQLVSGGTGVVATRWDTQGDSLIVVKGDALWLDTPGSIPLHIAGPLFPVVAPSGYYGQVGWESQFAWHRP